MSMKLYEVWEENLKTAAPKEAQAYLEKYYEKEKQAYAVILGEKQNVLSGTVKELAEKLGLGEVETAGFIDGINTSLQKEVILEPLEPDTAVTLDIDWEKLYFNMHAAKADWLYHLPEWDGILSEERRSEIAKEYKASLQAKSEHVGRNDPCPCGSGKKYKKCCGA